MTNIVCISSLGVSIVLFIGAHWAFGIDYVLNYFISVFLISVIPMWTVVYVFLRNIYEHYYTTCIIEIFEIKDNGGIISRIFGLNKKNVIISLGISSFIFFCYIYFGENCVIIMPEVFKIRVRCYIWGVLPVLYGSFSGAIMVRAMSEAWNFLKSSINRRYIDNYLFNLKKLKYFLNISIASTYAMCLLMYITVLLGPRKENEISQPLVLFLLFLILWPLIIHIFCRIYFVMVREKCFEEKICETGNITVQELSEELKKRKRMTRLFSDHDERYKSFSLLLSVLLSISQIIVLFIE